MSERRRATAWFILSAAIVVWGCSRAAMGLDYRVDAAPAIDALAAGDPSRALDEPPVMGPVSILLRAPVVAVVDALGGDSLARYQAGAVVCLLVLSLVAAWIAQQMARARQPLYAQAAVIVGLSLAPFVLGALKLGHPEEATLGALAVAGVLAAGTGRVHHAVVWLVLAVATKPTAVLAIGPAYIALPAETRRDVHRKLLPGAAAATALIALAAWSVRSRISEVLNTGKEVRFASIWWPFAESRTVRVFDGVEYRETELRELPLWFGRFPHAVIPLLFVPATILHTRFGRQSLADGLALLALLMLLRCALDPVNNVYYHLPFIIALAAWEATARSGLPTVTIGAIFGLWLALERIAGDGSVNAANALYIVIAVGLTAVLLRWMYGPRKALPATS